MDPPIFQNNSQSEPIPRKYLNYHSRTPRNRSSLSREYIPGDSESDLSDDSVNDTAIMSLPGLGLEFPDDLPSNEYATGNGPQLRQTQEYILQKDSELRFEVPFGRTLTVKAVSGNPEIYGTELVVGRSYHFTGVNVAVFTFTGCAIDVTSDYGAIHRCVTSEYVAEETPLSEYLQIHWSIERLRIFAIANGIEGPRILIVGPEASGKTSLAKTLCGFAVRNGKGPMIVNMDPNEGMLTLPGTMTACVIKTGLEVEEGWGNAPMSGPNGEVPVKVPVVYYYGSLVPEEKDGVPFKKLTSQVALTVSGRCAQEDHVRISGVIVDTPGSIVDGRAAASGFDILAHTVSEFGINKILCLGSERLYSDLVRKFEGKPSSRTMPPMLDAETISVVKVTKSGGVVERDANFMRAARDAQTKAYFYGTPNKIPLQPRHSQVDFDSITVWRRISATGSGNSMASIGGPTADEDNFLPGDAGDDEYVPQLAAVPLPTTQLFERLTAPIPALRNCILAVMNCDPDPAADPGQAALRDASVMGFLYVTDIDEARGRIGLLSPVVGRIPHRALIWAEGMDAIMGLT